MNWDALGAVAELVGAVGVIASLFYLASQIRRNSTALEVATNQAIADATQYRLLAPAQSPELAAAFAKAFRDPPEELSSSERVQLIFFSRATFRGIENAFFQHRQGLMSDDAWHGYERVLRTQIQYDHVQKWWHAERATFDPVFIEQLESAVRESSAP